MAEDITTIKLPKKLKEELDSIKYYETEPVYNVVKRLIEENKQLKEDKKELYKMALATEDSAALINNVHKATYFIAKVIEDVGTAEEEKLQVLKTYLKEMLEEDPTSILTAIEILKDMAEGSSLDILTKFENYVKTSSWSSNFFSYWPSDRP